LLHLSLFGLRIDILSEDKTAGELILANFSAFTTFDPPTIPAECVYGAKQGPGGYVLSRLDTEPPHDWEGLDAAELLFVLEKDLTIEAQKRLPHLYFMHAASLLFDGRVFLLIGKSGNGKSTTCWGLLHHGCGYLSDELAPIDVQNYTVQPYPHALCLKSAPAAPYSLPQGVLHTDPTLHVPVELLPSPIIKSPQRLSTIIHVRHIGVDHPPTLEKLSTAEAGMLIYANALNPLSHDQDGLDTALNIARHCQTYQMTTGKLDASISKILTMLKTDGS